MSYFNPKEENLSYTLAIIKPETALKEENIRTIIELLEQRGFIIQNMLHKELTQQESQNIFYKHLKTPYYPKIEQYMLSSPSIIILLCHQTQDPIQLWKQMIGDCDPNEAKKLHPESLRAKFGTSLIRNEFHGSDSPFDANKERDIFKFPIPQKVPDFKFDKFLVNKEMIMKWLWQENIEHPDVLQRLDSFALYGPVVNWHSVDKCFCQTCARAMKEYLDVYKQHKVQEEKERIGIVSSGETQTNTKKVKSPYIRVLKEDYYNQLCTKCRHHVSTFVHMASGREEQIIMSDQEIQLQADDQNRTELMDVLTIEKGNIAEMMLSQISVKWPKEYQYDKEHIELLLQDLETDYYNRYQFSDLQQVILEDRRIRMTHWVSELIHKPVDRFRNPKLVDENMDSSRLKNLKSPYFTISPSEENGYYSKMVNQTPIQFDYSMVDKKKFQKNEEPLVREKMFNRHSFKLIHISEMDKIKETIVSLSLMRNYNEGRHGNWNNYCCLRKV